MSHELIRRLRRPSTGEFLVSGGCLVFLLFYFFWERVFLSQKLEKIPLRICVTGTRGKSSVTRLIAACLREAGFKVVAKTTGSRPVVIFPDGREEEIQRIGPASFLEQKKILKLGARFGAEALVAELMSIQPECLKAESLRILKPTILVITNVRLDHRDVLGRTRKEVAAALSASIGPQSAIFIPEEEFFPVFEEAASRSSARIILVSKKSLEDILNSGSGFSFYEFEENLRLALAVSEFVGIKKDAALKGIARAQPDFGRLKIWKVSRTASASPWFLVSAFAANEPESTAKVLLKIKEKIPIKGARIIGLLNFREDRGDRTLQWLEALEEGYFSGLSRLVLVGGHIHSLRLKRKMRSTLKIAILPLPGKRPEKIMENIFSMEKDEAVVVGMGNMGGLGRKLVEYWERVGSPYGV